MKQPNSGSLSVSLIREVDKVLSGLEILSKVFDQQSAFMVSKMIQQVQLFASLHVSLHTQLEWKQVEVLFHHVSIILHPLSNTVIYYSY